MAEIAPYSTASTDVRHNPYVATGTGAFLCPDCGQLVHMLKSLGDRWVCVTCWRTKTQKGAN